jgi:hypothetical protein
MSVNPKKNYKKPEMKEHGNLKKITKDKGGLGGDAKGEASL